MKINKKEKVKNSESFNDNIKKEEEEMATKRGNVNSIKIKMIFRKEGAKRKK